MIKYDEEFTRTFNNTKIDYGIIKGNNIILFIKSGQNGSMYGYRNKYYNIAKKINSKFKCSVICSSNPFDGKNNPLEDAIKVIEEYCKENNFKDYEVYYVGNSNGGFIGARWGYLYPCIKRMLLINTPLMINLYYTKNGIKNFNGEKVYFMYGTKDLSCQFVPLLNNIGDNVEYYFFKGQDHYFSCGKDAIYNLIKDYLFEISSHKYIAESILKRFSNNQSEINYYDFSDHTIKKEKISKFNTEYNHYSKNNEINLSKNAETNIGRLITKITESSNINQILLSDNDIECIKKYVSYQMLRDDGTMEYLRKFFIDKLKNNDHVEIKEDEKKFLLDFLTSSSTKELKNNFMELESLENIVLNAYKDYGVVIIINNTMKNYLLTTGIYVENDNTPLIKTSLTISPNIIISFCKKDIFPKTNDSKDFIFLEENDENSVLNYNKKIFNRAKNFEPNILIGMEKDLQDVISM